MAVVPVSPMPPTLTCSQLKTGTQLKKHIKPRTNHRPVAQEPSGGAKSVRDYIQGRRLVRLEVPQSAPSGMTVDLEWTASPRKVKEYCECRGYDDGLES
jgi:hypothetical protein